MNEHTNLLEIKDLTVHYVTVDGTVHAVENLNLTLPEGKTLELEKLQPLKQSCRFSQIRLQKS